MRGTLALLFGIWFDVPHRPTHDADLLGFGSTEIPHLENLFREISQIASRRRHRVSGRQREGRRNPQGGELRGRPGDDARSAQWRAGAGWAAS